MDGQSGEFIHSKLGRLNGELNTITNAIAEIENEPSAVPAGSIEIEDVSAALQRLDPIWEVLVPDEQQRVLELLVEKIIVAKTHIKVFFRADGVEQIVAELSPLGQTTER